MLDTLFRALFKYERLVFEQGQFVLGATRSMWFTAAIVLAAAAVVLWTYWQVAVLRGRDRAVLLALRTGLVAVALFALLRPVLLLKVAVPQQNFVGIVLDDSRSMRVTDEGGRPRSQYVIDQFGTNESPLVKALAQRFNLRVFRFSTVAERLQSTVELGFQGTSTRVADALERVRNEMTGLPVAGLVVVSDGADNADRTLDQAIAGLKAQGMPVFAVGVGKERLSRDVQVSRAETPRRVLQGASLVVDVVVTQSGYAGTKVPLVVEDEGRVLSTQDITLPADGEAMTVKVRFKAGDAGARSIRFRVPVQSNEEVVENNQRDTLVDVYSRREKILYVEGEPRPEAKFVDLATRDDPNVQVVILQRTAEATVSAPDKYYRKNVDGPEELADGFPASAADLFTYRGLVLGSIEAAAFTPEQLRLLEEFVAVRGGGLMALGGFRSFAQGGWAGTPLADALPIAFERGTPAAVLPPLELMVRPTRLGEGHPVAQITERPEAAAAKWAALPALTAVNAVSTRDVKPGAQTLLSAPLSGGRDQVVLAAQRYGRGKALALPVQDTWMWRMHATMAVDDTTHRDFWQRLARWLIDGVPDRVMPTVAPERVQRGEPVTIGADVFDREYKGVNEGRIVATITSPSGRVEDVPMEWNIEHDGEYHGRFTPSEDGLYRVAIGGTAKDGADVGRGTVAWRVAPSDAEFFDAGMRAPLLQRIAEDTEGRFFRAADAAALPEAISYSGKGITVVQERELWDMPIVLALLLGLMGGEWLYRRARGLA
ncbi:MAG: hypothetical protein IT184_18680 [Acidobacteria bacterium]|nr:hypothetical protein [Acidobacteriota bacterium]